MVQWQDGRGSWHTVEGWQGGLDRIALDESGGVVGVKTWWVGEAQLGGGPFRWSVYLKQGGTLLVRSGSFHLPSSQGEGVQVEVTLWAP